MGIYLLQSWEHTLVLAVRADSEPVDVITLPEAKSFRSCSVVLEVTSAVYLETHRAEWSLLFYLLSCLSDELLPLLFCGAKEFLEQDGALEEAQRIAGHADSRTTKLYDRRGRKIKQEEIQRLRFERSGN